jgi:hypothetical protein
MKHHLENTCLNWLTIPEFSWRDWGNLRNNLVTIASGPGRGSNQALPVHTSTALRVGQLNLVGFEVPSSVTIKITLFLDVTPFSLVDT